MPGSVGCGSVKRGDFKGNGPYSALKIGAYGGCKNAEFIFRSGFYAQNISRGKQKRTQIERRAASIGRNIFFVRFYDFSHGIQKFFFRIDGHFESLGGLLHSFGVQIGAKADDLSVLCGIGFETFKTGLCIL